MQLDNCLRVLNRSVDVGFSKGRLPKLDYWRVLAGACLHNTSPEAVSGEGLPSADCVLGYMGLMDWVEVQKSYEDVIAQSVSLARRQGWFRRPLLCAVDYHDDLYYGERVFGVMGCQSKRGTNKCFRIATLEVCEAGRRFTLAVTPVFKGTKTAEVIRYLVRQARKHVRIKYLLMDRGFFSIDVFRALNSLKLKYIVCAKKTGKLLGSVEGKTHIQYTLEKPSDSYTINLTAHRPDEETLWVYATNLHSKHESIAYTYKKRWGIETGYKSKNHFNANTTSKNYAIRIFLILLAITLYNLWILTNLIADSTIIRKTSRKNQYSTKVTIFQFKQSFIRQLADHG